jgi:RNA polymerase sigma-70 factor (ECF subfamily)
VALSEPEFENVFTEHYATLYRYAFGILRDEVGAEEMVSAVFCRLWQKRATLPADPSSVGYVYTAVHHACMDHLKHNRIKKRYENHLVYAARQAPSVTESAHRAEAGDFQKQLLRSLETLPQQCRIIFHLSRVEELSHKDIAARLGLSVKTVEVQIGRALKRLRISLADFLPLLIIGYGIFF